MSSKVLLGALREKRAGAFYIGIGLLFAVLACWVAPSPFAGSSRLEDMVLSDEATIAAFALAKESPELFREDYFLSDPHHFKYYTPWIVAVVRWGGRVLEDYLGPFPWLSLAVTFVHLWGFFLLGKVLFGRRETGLLLALASLGSVEVGKASWGSIGFLAGGVFNALLPYGLAALWLWRGRLWIWPLALAACGLLVYVHPVSAPVWVPAIVVASFVTGERRHIRRRAGWLFLGMFIFMLFSLGFIRSHAVNRMDQEPLSESQWAQFLDERSLRLPSYALDARHFTVATLFGNWKKSPAEWMAMGRRWLLKNAMTKGLLPFILLGICGLVLAYGRPETREIALWTAALASGIATGALLVPVMIQWIERRAGIVPFVFELQRGVAFLFPLVFVMVFAGLSALGSRFPSVIGEGRGAILLQAVFVIAWLLLFPPRAYAGWAHRVPAVPTDRGDLEEMLTYVRGKTAPGTVFVGYGASRYLPWPPEDLSLLIRIYGRRPVAFSWKDGASLLVRNPAGFLAWAEKYRSARETLPSPWKEGNDALGFCRVARSWGADLWLAPAEVFQPGPASEADPFGKDAVLYRNGSYALMDLERCSS